MQQCFLKFCSIISSQFFYNFNFYEQQFFIFFSFAVYSSLLRFTIVQMQTGELDSRRLKDELLITILITFSHHLKNAKKNVSWPFTYHHQTDLNTGSWPLGTDEKFLIFGACQVDYRSTLSLKHLEPSINFFPLGTCHLTMRIRLTFSELLLYNYHNLFHQKYLKLICLIK